MKVAIGSDHAGYELKRELVAYIGELEDRVWDMGTDSVESVDYPDYAKAVGEAVADGRADRGILLCGSGVGVSVAANKIVGVRAAICHDTYSAHQGVEHDDMNLLVMGARIIGVELAKEIVCSFLDAMFVDEERFRRRLEKILALERQYLSANFSPEP
ncbi:MAG: ribose 5-phosphate isomerase B [Candidatus Cloacimonetes bacterium 4572_55]|nr:MAG: ribose 5-phosphate isomerase B [Candidatus Cloacimonetes bacterium 4572_55]